MLRPKLRPGAGYALLWMLYVEELMTYGAPLQLEAPTRFWYQCADTRLDPCPRPSRYCVCSEGPYGCGNCCSCLGGCVEQADEADHWAAVRRRWYGQLEPCTCWPIWPIPHVLDPQRNISRSSVYEINPGCPHHGDARHTCNVAMLGRSRHSEGMGWRCPPCGATWTLKRVQEPSSPERLYPTMQWIRN